MDFVGGLPGTAKGNE
ncbi:hypothetical protein A2U01_0112818, partial [Trifolium medium]|nr:hypothetical protein [Trifolium medium]